MGRMSKSVASWRRLMAEVLLVVAAVTLAVAPLRPSWIESWYSATFYPRIERTLTPISNQLPFALLDLLLVVLVAAVLVSVGGAVRDAWRTRSVRRVEP